jgi:hypothetical protein
MLKLCDSDLLTCSVTSPQLFVFCLQYSYLFIFNCNWVDTRWQQYSTHLVDTRWQQHSTHLVDTRWQQHSTHLHTNSTQNTENGTYRTINKNKREVRAVPRLCELYPGICLTTEGKARKTSVRVVENCPDIPVAVVQYTFTHKQYTEQLNGREYTEWNIHNNKYT